MRKPPGELPDSKSKSVLDKCLCATLTYPADPNSYRTVFLEARICICRCGDGLPGESISVLPKGFFFLIRDTGIAICNLDSCPGNRIAYLLTRNYYKNNSLRITFVIFDRFWVLKISRKKDFSMELRMKFVMFVKIIISE